MKRRLITRAAYLVFALGGVNGCYHAWKPLPEGVSYQGAAVPSADVRFVADLTYVDPAGERQVEQRIFDEVFQIIRGARELIVLDMFLFNEFQGDVREETRALASELTQALIDQKRAHPDLNIVFLTDPVNTVYGGLNSPQLDALENGGVQVVVTDLDQLRDSNPIYSSVWRVLFRPFGTGGLGALPNPFGAGRVSFRTYLRLINFKANHRKTVLADSPSGYTALVTSANPHDGSSAHGNVALRFSGEAVHQLFETERAVWEFSGVEVPDLKIKPIEEKGGATVQVVTEGKIGESLSQALKQAASGDRVDVAVFYLSDRGIVGDLVDAHERGARLRVLLDPNKDAFGMEKNGVPNRPVAARLHRAGIPVRWCDTHGEQCHAKLLHVHDDSGESSLILGSANFTRRNLRDFNLETNVVVRAAATDPVMQDAAEYFERVWANEATRHFSTDYESYRDTSLWKRFLYGMSETTGIGTY